MQQKRLVTCMLGSMTGALADRMDSKFLTAYWLPAFVFGIGVLWTAGLAAGPGQPETWISSLNSVEQTLGALFVVLQVCALAFALRALSHPIMEMFSGIALPGLVADRFRRGQLRAKHRASLGMAGAARPDAPTAEQEQAAWLQSRFPSDDQNLKPTLLGNLLASVGEHPRFAYSMEGAVWWPRLSPLLPGSFQNTLAAAQAPMMALLNLSVVFCGLAGLGILAGMLTRQWLTMILLCSGSIVLSRLTYRAAVSQAAEVASMLRVAFDLYRYDILGQLGKPSPEDMAAERALWLSLTREVLGQDTRPPALRME